VREPDGVAMSSRNAYLSPDERRSATVLVRALRAAADAVEAGEREARTLRELVTTTVGGEPAVRLDYAEVVDAVTIQPVDRLERDTLIALAAFVGSTRLIDNVAVSFDGKTVSVDRGLTPADAEVA
jgi:pantoate--beta-alanine ligase